VERVRIRAEEELGAIGNLPAPARAGDAARYDSRVSTAAPEIPPDVIRLIEQKKFEDLEEVWTRRMVAAPRDHPFFFGVAAAVKKKGGTPLAVSWLRFLADSHGESGDLDARLDVLAEIARMAPGDTEIRGELEKALRARFAGHPSLAAVLQQQALSGSKDPSASAGRARRWLAFSPGQIGFLRGRGAGRIVELNPALDVIRVEIAGTRLPLSLVSAEKSLEPLPEGHFLRRKVEDPAQVRELAESKPVEAVRDLLASFGGRLTLGELKEHLAGIVPDARWSSFWTAARKSPHVLVSGTGKGAAVSWSESLDAAEGALRREFEAARPERKMELARQNARRSGALARFFAETLRTEAASAAERDPSLAWELSCAAARLTPGEPEAYPAERLLAAPDLPRRIAAIREHTARERALEAVRAAGRPDAEDLFAEQFLREEDGRVLSALWGWLGENETRRQELARRTLRAPRTAPRAFLWLAERVRQRELPAPAGLFVSLLDALRQEEFGGVRARLKELFDAGNLAVLLAQSASSEGEAREMLAALDRAGGLEEHRRITVREALLMKFPELRAPAHEYLYATPEAIETRRRELQHLRQVELPANAEQMRAAKEHGDLSENFEYHAARQRHEYLSARIATLADELSRSRPLEPSRVDASEVRVGTRVRLRDEDGGEREVTILGPWDSRPEESIYSYQSEFAQRLLGAKPGERVSLPDYTATVVSVAPWKA